KAPAIADNALQFGRLTAPGDSQHRVILRDHAEIAMAGFRRMDEGGRRAGRGEGCRELGADMPALADPGNDKPAGKSGNEVDGAPEGLAKAVPQRLFEGCEALPFDADGPQGGCDD